MKIKTKTINEVSNEKYDSQNVYAFQNSKKDDVILFHVWGHYVWINMDKPLNLDVQHISFRTIPEALEWVVENGHKVYEYLNIGHLRDGLPEYEIANTFS